MIRNTEENLLKRKLYISAAQNIFPIFGRLGKKNIFKKNEVNLKECINHVLT